MDRARPPALSVRRALTVARDRVARAKLLWPRQELQPVAERIAGEEGLAIAQRLRRSVTLSGAKGISCLTAMCYRMREELQPVTEWVAREEALAIAQRLRVLDLHPVRL